jgi:AcrR family transcriptional regulator
MAKKQEYNKKLKRLTILKAAEKIFLEKPYSAITVDEVAREAGVTKRTLYAYFPSKLALFIQMFEDYLALLNDQFFHAISETTNLGQMIEKMFSVLFSHTKENVKFYQLFWTLDSTEFDGEIPEELLQKIKLWNQALLDQAKKVVEKGQSEGIFRSVEPELLVHLLSAVNKGIFIQTSKERKFNIAEIEPDSLQELFVDIIANGLLISPEHPG